MPYKYALPTTAGYRNSEEDDDEDKAFPFLEKKKPYHQYDQILTAQQVHFYISKLIGPPDEYIDMIHRTAVAGPQDTIFIHLNTPGGHLDTGVQIINAMQNSQAKIVTILECAAYSLGTLIFLAGDEMVVNDNCLMMFHNFNGGLTGKGNEMVSELAASVKWFLDLATDIYLPFLTESELDRLIKGEDMWMQTPEIRSRLERMIKQLHAKQVAEDAATAAEIKKIEREVKRAAKVVLKPTKRTPPKKTIS